MTRIRRGFGLQRGTLIASLYLVGVATVGVVTTVGIGFGFVTTVGVATVGVVPRVKRLEAAPPVSPVSPRA